MCGRPLNTTVIMRLAASPSFHVRHRTAHGRRKRVMITAYGQVAAVDRFAVYAIIFNRSYSPHVPLAAVAYDSNAWFIHDCTCPILFIGPSDSGTDCPPIRSDAPTSRLLKP